MCLKSICKYICQIWLYLTYSFVYIWDVMIGMIIACFLDFLANCSRHVTYMSHTSVTHLILNHPKNGVKWATFCPFPTLHANKHKQTQIYSTTQFGYFSTFFKDFFGSFFYLFPTLHANKHIQIQILALHNFWGFFHIFFRFFWKVLVPPALSV